MADHSYTTVAQEYCGNSRRLYSTGGKRQNTKEQFSRSEMLQWGRILVCAAIFLALVVTKVNMPERFQDLRAAFSAQMQNDVDYREVFSAVGRVVSGEASVQETMNDVYMEVFHPGYTQAVETAVTVPLTEFSQQEPVNVLLAFSQHWDDCGTWLQQEQARGAKQVLAPAAVDAPDQAETVQESAPPAETGAAEEPPAVAYDPADLPENVCMEQQVLGFSYTTPADGWLSSPFGYREHPVDGEEKFHRGIDIAASEGSDIVSFADGTVKAVGESSSLGKYVMVSHANNITTLYAHCSKCTVSSGTTVKKGEKIALVGQTGITTGPHLHFAILQGETYLNPIYYVTLEELA